jgi:hypothetical protein
MNRPFNWGKRYYYFNCIKEGHAFGWLQNNLNEFEAGKISASWTFNGKWDPESGSGPEIIKYELGDRSLLLFFNEIITVIDIPVIKTESGNSFVYHSGGGSNTIRFITDTVLHKKDFKIVSIENGRLMGTMASVTHRDVIINF